MLAKWTVISGTCRVTKVLVAKETFTNVSDEDEKEEVEDREKRRSRMTAMAPLRWLSERQPSEGSDEFSFECDELVQWASGGLKNIEVSAVWPSLLKKLGYEGKWKAHTGQRRKVTYLDAWREFGREKPEDREELKVKMIKGLTGWNQSLREQGQKWTPAWWPNSCHRFLHRRPNQSTGEDGRPQKWSRA